MINKTNKKIWIITLILLITISIASATTITYFGVITTHIEVNQTGNITINTSQLIENFENTKYLTIN